MTPKPESPYKGLNAFEDSELDALLFFGRERETEIVVANLIASRLTVLYGPSGVGKSSLLSAAVARSLRALPESPLVVLHSRWSDDPSAALAEAIAEAEGRAPTGAAPLEALMTAQQDRDVYLVLDQAEEYFLYHADDGGPGSFAEALPAALTGALRINVLVSLREDSLAKLDRFTGRVPGLFANTLRLDRLDRQSARTAIVGPLERYAELTGLRVAVEPELIERVLDEVGIGRIEPALGGRGAIEGADDTARIEAPYLQLVMQRLWEEERGSGSDVLSAATLERLGGAQHIVEEHFESAMDALSPEQKDVAARLFNHLVTPSGTKIAHELSDLADFGGVPVDELSPVLATLADRRIVRSLEEGGDVRYEIFHDVLAQPVLAWRAEHEAERELELQKESSDRRHRFLLSVIAAGAVLLAVMGAVTFYALTQRTEAREQARDAKASELVASADAALDQDPELSLLLASEAARLVPGERSGRALRRALLASRVRGVVDVGVPLVAAASIGSQVVAATERGGVIEANLVKGKVVRRTATEVVTIDASFADDGTSIVTARSGAVSLVALNGESTPFAADARAAALSPDGTRAVVVSGGGVVRLVSAPDGVVLHTYSHPGAISAAISPDNSRVLTGSEDDTVRVWSGQSGRRIHTLTEHAGNAVAVAFSPDGEFVATASTDGTGRIWRTSDWGLSSVLTGHTNALINVGFSGDGEHVVTAGKDGTARISHVESGDELIVLSGHRNWVTSAAFTGDAGSPVVTASVDGSIRIWDAVFQPELAELARLPAPVTTIAVDRRVHAVTSAGREYEVDLTNGQRVGVQAAPERRPLRVVGSDGAIATIRGRTVVLSHDGRRTILRGHRDRVTAVSFSSSGGLLATASLDHDVRVWDVASGEQTLLVQHNTAAHDAQFSPDGRWLVTAANRGGLWDVQTGSNVARLQGHDGTLTAAAFAPDGVTIVTGGVDQTIRTHTCEVCGGLDELLALAQERLAVTGRELTEGERERYLG